MTHTPSPASSSGSCFVGIDVAKDALDLFRSDTGELYRVDHTPAGIKKLVTSLGAARPASIVLEATGGLEEPLLAALLDASLPVARVNPGRVRHLAIALGILAKTDAIDARVLAEFARVAQPRLSEKRSQRQAELDALVTCRRQLVATQVDQKNRLASAASKHARAALNAVLATLQKQIRKLDQQIAELIDSDDDLKDLQNRLTSVPGVGKVFSTTLMAQLSELGSSDRRQVSALVGVAPFNHDSGKYRGKRAIRGGRRDLRNVLYMAANVAILHNPLIKSFAAKLKAAGKPPKVVIVACMRKLLTLLNAMVREKLSWNQLTVVKNSAVCS
jgi:transposase